MKRKVLLVEDSKTSVFIMQKELDLLGYECVVAGDGKEAVKKAKDERPDLILMDMTLPKMDGLQATQEIRKIPDIQAVPLIALTARAMPGDREKCLEAGCDEYLVKPVSHRQLAPLVDKLIGIKKASA
jgi:CheY-like chemotaxis protein